VRAHEQDESQQLLTLSEAAQRCGVSRSTVRRALDAGQLPGAVQDARRVWRVPVSALTAAGLTQADTGADLGHRTPPDTGGQADTGQSALTLLSQLAPLLEQLTNLQRERGDLQSELAVARHRLEQVERAERQPSRAGTGLLVAGGTLVAAGGAWALAPELHLLGAGVTAGAGVLAAVGAWLTR
jgi:excisionase family DNA binding protein